VGILLLRGLTGGGPTSPREKVRMGEIQTRRSAVGVVDDWRLGRAPL
jgi:hypothetical protein